jgi:hypothetical protein
VRAASKLPTLKAERLVNSGPRTAEGLRGKVVLVDVWGVHLHQLDSHVAVYQGLESRLRFLGWWWSECTRLSSNSASVQRT